MDESPNSGASEPRPIVLLGLGYTTSRLARRLLIGQVPVFAVARNPEPHALLVAAGLRISGWVPGGIPPGAKLIHTIPPLAEAENAALHAFVETLRPHRVIYISSTSVYGTQSVVTAESPVGADEGKGLRRIEEESWVAAGKWSSLILRPAAIYGPHRGVHVRVRNKLPPRGESSGLVSRIHVDDLARQLEAAIYSDAAGAWPVADERPSSTLEIAGWCAQLLGIAQSRNETAPAIAGRAVDGSAIRIRLGVELLYPTWEAGILASLAEETLNARSPSPAAAS